MLRRHTGRVVSIRVSSEQSKKSFAKCEAQAPPLLIRFSASNWRRGQRHCHWSPSSTTGQPSWQPPADSICWLLERHAPPADCWRVSLESTYQLRKHRLCRTQDRPKNSLWGAASSDPRIRKSPTVWVRLVCRIWQHLDSWSRQAGQVIQ